MVCGRHFGHWYGFSIFRMAAMRGTGYNGSRFSGSFWSSNTVNQNITAATHWYVPSGSIDAMYSLPDNLDTGSFYESYHNFEMVWDSTHVAMSLDSVQYFVMNTSGIQAFQQPQFVILNLAVGGSNYVEITDTSQITAPFPAKIM